jgi:hypothetical protein
MLRRLWLLISVIWAVIVLWSVPYAYREIEGKDLILAFFPLVMGWLLARAARFVVQGR